MNLLDLEKIWTTSSTEPQGKANKLKRELRDWALSTGILSHYDVSSRPEASIPVSLQNSPSFLMQVYNHLSTVEYSVIGVIALWD